MDSLPVFKLSKYFNLNSNPSPTKECSSKECSSLVKKITCPDAAEVVIDVMSGLELGLY
jgi:hypothetical protein